MRTEKEMSCTVSFELNARALKGDDAVLACYAVRVLGDCLHRCAEHGLDQLMLVDIGHRDLGDILAIAQDGGPVADVHHLGQPVGNEHGRAAAFFPTPQQRKDPLRLVSRQRRRDLVKQQHMWVTGDGAGQIDHAQRLQRQLAHQG